MTGSPESTGQSPETGSPAEPRWVDELGARAWTVAVAESMTGGLLAGTLASSPGCGEVFSGGVITYHTALKQRLLGIEGIPVISAECAEAMAAGVVRLCDVEVGVSITGVAGPDTQENKPVGLVFGAVTTPTGTMSREWHFSGAPDEIRAAAVDAATDLLIDTLSADQDRLTTPADSRAWT